MLKIKNTYVLVAKNEDGSDYELVEHQTLSRQEVDRLGFSVDPKSDESVIAITLEEWEKEV